MAIKLYAVEVVDIFFICVAAISTVVRFYARWRATLKLRADDWLVIPAFVCALVLAVLCVIGAKVPYETSITIQSYTALSKVKFATEFFYIGGITLAKLSILFLYKRLFTANRTPIAISVLMVVTCLWFIAFFFATLFQSGPVYCNYDIRLLLTGACPSDGMLENIYVANATLDVVLDISILCLPAFFIRKLKVPLWKRFALVGIFALGTVVLVASIARLAYAAKFYIHWNDFYSESVSESIDVYTGIYYLWPSIEVSLAVTCANLPCYGTLRSSSQRGSQASSKQSSKILLRLPWRRSRADSNEEKPMAASGSNEAGHHYENSESRNASGPQNQSFSGPTEPYDGLIATQQHRDLEMNTA